MSDVSPSERRLPVYLLLDCSGSMAGEPIAALQIGLNALVNELRDDPYALETVWLSVLTFASTADQAVHLTDINEFSQPTLEAGGTTALGEALTLLSERIADTPCFNEDISPCPWRLASACRCGLAWFTAPLFCLNAAFACGELFIALRSAQR